MSFIPDNVRQEINKLVPSSVNNDISCFVFFDGHPRDQNRIDIAICTKSGEVKEFFQRDLVLSLHLDIPKLTEISIFRNDKADPFYLVLGGDELLILSRGENLKIHKRIRNVDRYEIGDETCSGQASLKVFVKDDAVPLVYNDNFEIVEDICYEDEAEDSAPILIQLMRKLTEAKYSVKFNEKMYEKLSNLRQLALFSKYQKINVNANDAVYKIGLKEVASALKIDTMAPWVKICNKKIVIAFDIINQDNERLEEIQVLLHGTTRPVITYTTKHFEKISISPFWREKKSHNLKLNKKTAIVVVVDLDELKFNIPSKIMFDAVIMFKKLGNELLLPLERITISSLDTMKEDFDVLHSNAIDDPNTILALLATTEKTDLHMRHIKGDNEREIFIQDIFRTHLQMEEVPNMSNVVIHRKSPYHTLHGVMILMQDADCKKNDFIVSVFTRLPSQVLALVHFINDAVPAKILITTPNYKIQAKANEFSHYNEEVSNVDLSQNCSEYAASILNRMSTLLEYLDKMMVKMNVNRNPTVQSKIGREIHLFADGVPSYIEFRDQMLKMADKGTRQLLKQETFSEEDCVSMVID